jgi:hypothetical protein
MGFGNYGWLDEDEDDDTNATALGISNGCLHDWKQYTGFTESYWFCSRCDLKREDDPKNDDNSGIPWWRKG